MLFNERTKEYGYSIYEWNGNKAPENKNVNRLIFNLAKKMKIEIGWQYVCQGGFEGDVAVYPESFLKTIDIKTGKLKTQKTKCL